MTRLVETFTEDGMTYIVTKFVPSCDLLTYMQTNEIIQMPTNFARSLVHSLAHALRYVHSLGLVHRDLKHTAVLVKDQGDSLTAKLGDFGLTCLIGHSGKFCNKSGTIAFMAPEVLLNDYADFKVDVWALGIILYSILSGEIPFRGEDHDDMTTEIIQKDICSCNPKFWATLSPNL